MNLKKLFFIFASSVFLFFAFSFCAFAEEDSASLFFEKDGILAVSYRGDTENFPSNSLEGALSAQKKGAHGVSLSVSKTKDGVFVLSERAQGKSTASDLTFEELKKFPLLDSFGKETEYKMSSLEELLEKTDNEIFLILDVDFSEGEEVFELLKTKGAEKRTALRFSASPKEIDEFCGKCENPPYIIGYYKGNIIWTAASYLNTLSRLKMPAVQYCSKNYFAVCYGSVLGKKYLDPSSVRVMASTYDLDKSGQRGDCSESWDELVSKGFSIIETGNISELSSYIKNTAEVKSQTELLQKQIGEMKLSEYSSVSSEKLKKALDSSLAVTSKPFAGLSELQRAKGQLLFSLSNLRSKTEKETQRGALSVTPGKVAAIIIIAVVILAAEIYVHKMQSEKKRRKNAF